MFTTKRVVWGTAAVLAAASVSPRPLAGWLGAWMQPAVAFTLLPATFLHTAMVDNAGAEAGGALPAGDEGLRIEVERLRQENERLRIELAEVSMTSELLEQLDVTPLRARVSGVSGTRGAPTLTIARGSRHGVRPGMTVVSGNVLVGRVVDPVGPATATVAPALSQTPTLGVTLFSAENERLADERLTAETSAGVWTASVAVALNVQPGTLVRVADELTYEEAAGYLLGEVRSVTPDRGNPHLLRRLEVTPAVDFASLGRVVVLLTGS